jgi:hypothetical protein
MVLAMSTSSDCVTGFTKYPLTPNPSTLALSWAWLEEVRTMTGRVGHSTAIRQLLDQRSGRDVDPENLSEETGVRAVG